MAEARRSIADWLYRQVPDVVATARRFPLPTVFAALATVVFLIGANGDWDGTRLWFDLFMGLGTGAVCAVAGVLFREDRPDLRVLGRALAYLLPPVVAALMLVQDESWVVPMPLLAAAILWLSVSASTRIGRGAARDEQQNRFWWLNHRAIASVGLAVVGVLTILLGILAVERSLAYLFGLDIGDVLYRWVMPVVAFLLAPVYWLSTLPRLADYQPAEMERPEFTAGALGFLGQFVLAPFLGIYALILLAYAAQIAITQHLPQGTIGWMVLGFVVAGAGTWLLLHPPFMRGKPLVRLFRRAWFWLTVIPLALFCVAVWVRLDAYGLTSERLVLVTGGVWSIALTAVFLAGRGDIRLMPALAGAIFLVFGVGPWNYAVAPGYDQAARLGRLLADTRDPSVSVAQPDWDADEVAKARSAIDYLVLTTHGRRLLVRTLLDAGLVYEAAAVYPEQVMTDLGYPGSRAVEEPVMRHVPRPLGVAVDVRATPYYIGHQEVWGPHAGEKPGLDLALAGGVLEIYWDGAQVAAQDLSAWANRQSPRQLDEFWLDFAIGDSNYRLVLTNASWRPDAGTTGRMEVTQLSGVLFTDDAASTIPRP